MKSNVMARNSNGFVLCMMSINGTYLECVLHNFLLESPVKTLNSSVFSCSRFVGIEDAAVMNQ